MKTSTVVLLGGAAVLAYMMFSNSSQTGQGQGQQGQGGGQYGGSQGGGSQMMQQGAGQAASYLTNAAYQLYGNGGGNYSYP